MSIATALQALQQAKTNIASAITQRGGTVNSGDGFSDFAACIATIPQGSTEPSEPVIPSVPVNFEVHRVTVSTTLTGSNKTLLSNVQFIKDHMNDEGFAVIIINVTPIPYGTSGVGFVYRGNRPICGRSSGYYYGAKVYGSGTSQGAQLTSNPFSATEWNGFPGVTATGNLFVNCNTTTGAYIPGEYLVMLAVI